MKTEVQKIESLLRHSFEKNAWYGPSLNEVLEGITQTQSETRVNNTHSIIELVAHLTSWRKFVLSRLNGPFDFEVTDGLNFPKVSDWNQVRRDLEESQEKLLAALKDLPESKLHELVPHGSYKYTYYTLLHGIIHHDVYHTGQISLIKKTFA